MKRAEQFNKNATLLYETALNGDEINDLLVAYKNGKKWTEDEVTKMLQQAEGWVKELNGQHSDPNSNPEEIEDSECDDNEKMETSDDESEELEKDLIQECHKMKIDMEDIMTFTKGE